jgi:hypothetical protein
MGSNFLLYLVFRPEMYFQTGQVFLSQNGQMGSLLVFLLATFGLKQKHFYEMVAGQSIFPIFRYLTVDF